jgi:trehalose-6-phosphate synthase
MRKITITPITASKSGLGQAGGLSTGLTLAYMNAIIEKRNPSWFHFGPGERFTLPDGSGTVRPLSGIFEEREHEQGREHYPKLVDSIDPLTAYHGHNRPNGVEWMLLHEMPEHVVFNKIEEQPWVQIQRAFANVVSDRMAKVEHPWLWAHDFQTGLSFAMVRRRLQAMYNKRAYISHFLHTPVPDYRNIPAQYLRSMDRLLRAEIWGADDLGVQNTRWQNNLCNWGVKRLNLKLDESGRYPAFIGKSGKRTYVVDQPIGSDSSVWRSWATSNSLMFDFIPDSTPFDPDLPTVLWGGRLDVTKGGPEFLMAIEILFEHHPELIGKVNFLMIAEATRHSVSSYKNVWKATAEVEARLISRFGNESWLPIVWVRGKVSPERLGPVYRWCRGNAVDPFMDGFNLMGWEFLICQNPDNPGVLGLSPGAGAHPYIGQYTVKLDPNNIPEMAGGLHQMLTMSQQDRSRLYRGAHAIIDNYPLSQWTRLFEDRARGWWEQQSHSTKSA